jgi:hypothetical protein
MAPDFNSSLKRIAEILEEDGTVVEARVSTQHGSMTFITDVRLDGNTLVLYDFHVTGPGPGSLGIGFLRRLADQVIAEYGVDAIEIHGFTRTTGASPGRVPLPIRFARR